MKSKRGVLIIGFLAGSLLHGGPARAMGYGDTQPRPMGLAGTYTALARGTEALYWNPANLALRDSPKYSLPLMLGFSVIGENNSISVADYNKYNGEFISESDKDDILENIDKEGLQFNTDLGLFLPVVGGVTFPLPWGLSSAIAVNTRFGLEGEIPKDMIELLLRGNQFARDRRKDGKDPVYDIAAWDGSAWGLGVFSWAFAKPWMPAQLKPYLDEFTVGGTLKIMGGVYGEVMRSDGGVETRVSGAEVDAYAITRGGGGTGFGVDLGVAGVTKDRKTTISVSLVNLLDRLSWNIETHQDSFFVKGNKLRVLSFTGKDDFTEVFDNPKDKDGDVVFHKEIEIESFQRSLPAMLRLGVAHKVMPRLTVAGNYDQAFSSGFGISPVPRVSAGIEYRLVDWFPTRFGLSVGGRAGQSSAIGFAFGPFTVKRFRLILLETAVVNRGGFFPGVAQGGGYSINLFRLRIKRA